jgi:uncharacterized C2H2 Zn-finger protein
LSQEKLDRNHLIEFSLSLIVRYLGHLPLERAGGTSFSLSLKEQRCLPLEQAKDVHEVRIIKIFNRDTLTFLHCPTEHKLWERSFALFVPVVHHLSKAKRLRRRSPKLTPAIVK